MNKQQNDDSNSSIAYTHHNNTNSFSHYRHPAIQSICQSEAFRNGIAANKEFARHENDSKNLDFMPDNSVDVILDSM